MADNLNAVGVSDADVEDGLTTLANKILTVGVEKIPTILTLNTPLVVYTDKFTVTGTLTDNEENPISEATIQLIWNDGSEHIATGATNANGVFSFTSTDPASVSSYSFQLFFAGDSDYAQSNSSVVNVNTSKETSVLVITSPASGAVVSTDSVTVSGTLKDNDNTPMSGKSIEYLLNGSSAGPATVESDGTFSKTVSGLSAGSNSIRCAISATTTHTAANQLITVNRSTFDGLTDLELIDGSQILSYADEQSTPNSQYATVETQLTNSGSPALIEGVTVDFYRYVDGVNDVYLDSVDTDSSGQADYTYHSAGIGDIKIYGKVGSFLTKTFVIEDIWKYVGTDATTIQNALTSYTLYPMGSSTATVTTDGTDIIIQSGNVGSNTWNRGELSFLNDLNNFSASMIIKGGTSFGFHLHNNDKLYLFTGYSSLPDTYVNRTTWSAPSLVKLDSSKEYIMEITYNSGSLLLKIFNLDGTEVLNTSRTVASNMSRFGFCYAKNTTNKFRDLKIRKL